MRFKISSAVLPAPAALIVAAGKGSRMGHLTNGTHKGLLRIADRPLIGHIVANFRAVGIEDIYVVTGYMASQLRDALGPDVTYIHNPEFFDTGPLHSAFLAADCLAGRPFVLSTADHFFPSLLAQRCLLHPADVVSMINAASEYPDDAVKTLIVDGVLVDYGKSLPGSAANGEYAGMSGFGPAGSSAFFEIAHQLIESRGPRGNLLLFDAVACIAKGGTVEVGWVTCQEHERVEVDYPDDLERARALAGRSLVAEIV